MEQRTLMYPWFDELWLRLSQHPAHAILLDAPPGWAIDTLAQVWAQSQLCDHPDARQHPCGTCASCHAFEVKSHPDLGLLFPEIYSLENEWPLDPAIQDALDKKERKPSRVIKIDQVREMIEFSQRTASRQGPKIIWIHPAEALTMESANALLKTLEEPVPGLRFILSSEHVDALIPTIRSRCQRLTLTSVNDGAVLAWLRQKAQDANVKGGDDDLQAAWLASGQRPMLALHWLTVESFHAESWNQLPEQVARGQAGCIQGWSAFDQLHALQMVAHDWNRVLHGALPRFFESRAFSKNTKPHPRKCSQWMHELTREMQSVDHPLNPQVSLHAWLSRSKSVFLSN
ncbi:MAG: hypothetical protein RLZZ397_774 [Pseudomonadota bacterium]|jgi:DNA polymerase-3 subunit delta'